MNRIILFLACFTVVITSSPTIVADDDGKFYSEMERRCGFSRKDARAWFFIKGKDRALRECAQMGRTIRDQERVMIACRFSDVGDVDALLNHLNLRYDDYDQATRHCNVIKDLDDAIVTMTNECAFPASRAPLHITFRGSDAAVRDCKMARDVQALVARALKPCEWRSIDTAFWRFAQKGWEGFSEHLREICDLDL